MGLRKLTALATAIRQEFIGRRQCSGQKQAACPQGLGMCSAQVLLNGEVIGVLERSNPRNLSLPNVFGSGSPNGDVRA